MARDKKEIQRKIGGEIRKRYRDIDRTRDKREIQI